MTAWFALLDRPDGELCTSATWAGRCGYAAAWTCDVRPHPQARRTDGRLLDADGPPAVASLLWPDLAALTLFDDPAVVRARRRARSLPAPRCVSTFTVDDRHFAGSLWVPADGSRLDEDPFAVVAPPSRLELGAGLLAEAVTLVGPAQERCSGAPWPSGAFARANASRRGPVAAV